MGSCYSTVGSNTHYSRLDHGPASVSARPRSCSDDGLENKATRNLSHDKMLVEAGLDSIHMGFIDKHSPAVTFSYSSKLKEEDDDQMGSCYNAGLNTRHSCLDHGSALVPTRPINFSEDVLKKATRNFSRDTRLVEAGIDSIYVGWIDEQTRASTKPNTGTAIAVKKLYYTPYDPYKIWMAEIAYLGQLNHQNIVKLIGYCYCRIHVYEFMPKGSLQSLLFGRSEDYEPLSRNCRLNIAVGVAKGLAYLDTTKANIRDHVLTSSMILIDSDYNAKLSNLEMEKRYNARVPPEYKVTGNLAAKGEVYSFGVILLELLTGRPAYRNVVALAKKYLRSQENMLHIMDPRIEGQYSSAAATHAFGLAMRCLMKDLELRPDADELVKELEQMQEW